MNERWSTPPVMMNLGALECASSCIMTALDAFGLNPRHFLLNYWDINYVRGNLLSSRIPWYLDLRSTYGIQLKSNQAEQLQPALAAIRNGHMIMYECKASALPYFPKQLLVHESEGFDHYCLLIDYDPAKQAFTVIDPIAGYTGELTAEEAAAASAITGKFCYYEVDRPPADFTRPSPEELFKIGATYNYQLSRSNPDGGGQAFTAFANELEASAAWDSDRRDAWLNANTITISSTIKIRKLIWESFAALEVLDEPQHAAFETLTNMITAYWTRLNLNLIKYKHRGDPSCIEHCRVLLEQLRNAEQKWLLEMHEQGSLMTVHAGAGGISCVRNA